MRVQAYYTYLSIPEKRHKKSITAFMPFKWDSKKKKPSNSLAEMRKKHFELKKQIEDQYKAA